MKRFNEKKAGVLSRADLKTFKGQIIYWMFFAVLIFTSLITVIPAIWTVLTAFKESREIYEAFSFFPKDLNVHKVVTRISESWEALDLGEAIVNTIILSLGNLFVHSVVCGFGGYALSKLKPRGSKFIFTLVVWTMMMPGQIRTVPNFISWLHFPFATDVGMGVSLLDTFWPMWLGAGADTYAVLLFKNAFDALSDSYVESAKLDGCTNYGVFFRIMLPLSMPIFIYTAIGVLSGPWADFFTPLLVLETRSVVPLKVYKLKTDLSIGMNTQFMALIITSIPPFLIFFAFQKHILGGVNIGGIKG